MNWHNAFVCTRTSHNIGCECMVWVDSMFSVDHGKSASCFVFDKLSWGHGKIDIGSIAWDFVQTERMILKKSENVQC